MKVLKKVLTAIGHFFRNIWRYIMTNAWIQPILIVALIFAMIFGLTAIPDLAKTVKSWFDDKSDEKIQYKYRDTVDYDEFMELYEGNEKFVIVFGADDCSNCKRLYGTINSYMKDKEHQELVDAKIYFLNITKLTDKIEDDLEKYKDELEVKSKAFKQYAKIADILYEGYAKILSEHNDNDEYSSLTTYGNYAETFAIQTPTTAFFVKDTTEGATNSKMFNMVVGTWEYKNSFYDINKLFDCWHKNDESARDALLANYTGTK